MAAEQTYKINFVALPNNNLPSESNSFAITGAFVLRPLAGDRILYDNEVIYENYDTSECSLRQSPLCLRGCGLPMPTVPLTSNAQPTTTTSIEDSIRKEVNMILAPKKPKRSLSIIEPALFTPDKVINNLTVTPTAATSYATAQTTRTANHSIRTGKRLPKAPKKLASSKRQSPFIDATAPKKAKRSLISTDSQTNHLPLVIPFGQKPALPSLRVKPFAAMSERDISSTQDSGYIELSQTQQSIGNRLTQDANASIIDSNSSPMTARPTASNVVERAMLTYDSTPSTNVLFANSLNASSTTAAQTATSFSVSAITATSHLAQDTNASCVTDLRSSPTYVESTVSNAELCLGIDLAEEPETLSQELIKELNESLNWEADNIEPVDYCAEESATDAPDVNLINRILNEPVPDQKDFFMDLHRVQRPRNTDQFSFFEQKKRTNNILKDVFETLNAAPDETELSQDPVGLTVPLMRHQRHALKWMEFIEKRHPYGGLLADDMGLGKTLSMLALVMAEKNRLQTGEADESQRAFDANTLVVCPPSLLHQWEMEVYTKFDYTLMPLVFYGKVNKDDIKNIKKFDIVITTYDTLLNHRLAKHICKLHWRRIVLDEAHIVRNPNTQKSEAVCCLSAKNRWALTGTPIHNKETDVFALLKFLKYTPFNERCYWNIWLSGHTRLGVLLRSIMLRRTKEALKRQNIMFDLPPQEIKTYKINLSDEEMEVHQAILSFSRPLVRRYIQQYLKRQGQDPTILITSASNGPTERDQREFLQKLQCDEANIGQHVIYVLLLRLTQVCCHPGLAEAMLYDDSDIEGENSANSQLNYSRTEQPMRCLGMCSRVKTELFTKTEPQSNSAQHNHRKPTVRQILNRKNPIFDLRHPSSKMLEVLRILQERVLVTADKAVIVSQYTSFLNVIEAFLLTNGISVLNFNGKMSLDERQKSLIQFNYDESASKVLLLSLKCGGVGLNLTAANHLILMDLPWNPQLEAQAQDRIYRLGQTKSVFVYKFLCTNTVEEHIKMKQDIKLKLASSVLTGADSLQNSGTRFSIVELKRLFGIND